MYKLNVEIHLATRRFSLLDSELSTSKLGTSGSFSVHLACTIDKSCHQLSESWNAMPDPQVMACHPIFPQVKETSENLVTNETNV